MISAFTIKGKKKKPQKAKGARGNLEGDGKVDGLD